MRHYKEIIHMNKNEKGDGPKDIYIYIYIFIIVYEYHRYEVRGYPKAQTPADVKYGFLSNYEMIHRLGYAGSDSSFRVCSPTLDVKKERERGIRERIVNHQSEKSDISSIFYCYCIYCHLFSNAIRHEHIQMQRYPLEQYS